MAGHDDGGWLIANVYTKLHQRRALDRAHRAMSEYAARHPAEEAQRPTARRPTNSRSATASAKNQRPVAVTAATLITYAETKPKTSVAGWTARRDGHPPKARRTQRSREHVLAVRPELSPAAL